MKSPDAADVPIDVIIDGIQVRLNVVDVADDGLITLQYEVLDKQAKYCRTKLEQDVNDFVNEALQRFIDYIDAEGASNEEN